MRAVVYYMATTVLAVILGIILVVSIRPGAGGIAAEDLKEEGTKRNVTTADTLMDLIRWVDTDINLSGKITFLLIQKCLSTQHHPSESSAIQNRDSLSG